MNNIGRYRCLSAARCLPSGLMLIFICLGALAPAALAAGPPTITSFSPKKGPVGTTVVIDGTNFIPPLSISFGGNVEAEGSFTAAGAIVTVPDGAEDGPITITTSGGKASTATDFILGPAGTPKATVTATIPVVTAESGKVAEFTVTLSDIQSKPTVVHYEIKGTAVDGTDYALLKEEVTIPTAKKTKLIKIVPKGDLGGAASKTVKLILSTGTDYDIGTPDTAKVRIVAKH